MPERCKQHIQAKIKAQLGKESGEPIENQCIIYKINLLTSFVDFYQMLQKKEVCMMWNFHATIHAPCRCHFYNF
jgi:hypothetical protein